MILGASIKRVINLELLPRGGTKRLLLRGERRELLPRGATQEGCSWREERAAPMWRDEPKAWLMCFCSAGLFGKVRNFLLCCSELLL